MTNLRNYRTILGAVGLMSASPTPAQFFFAAPDLTGEAVRGDEPGMGQPLPGATDAELRASLVWNMRAGLNVAALQCDFEPTLGTVRNYNMILYNHKDELKKSFDTITAYFNRVEKTKKLGSTALDQFGTRSYSGFTTVAAQYGFCQTAARLEREAVYVPRGDFHLFAAARMKELHNSLVPFGEQRFPRGVGMDRMATLPRLDDLCWTRKGIWNDRKCGSFPTSAFPA